MSNDFKKVSVIDDRLNTTDSLNYAVFRGGQNVTNVRMPAISTTANSLNFQIPFPSESTVLDREVFIQTQTRYFFELTENALGIPVYGPAPIGGGGFVSGPSPIVGHKCPIIYGHNISMSAFPTQRTCSTIQVQLNNNISTINSSDVLPALLRCADYLDWERLNMTASGVDRIAACDDEVLSVNNSNLSSYDLVQGNKFIGNGSFIAKLIPLTAFPTDPNGTLSEFSYTTQTTTAGTTFFCIEYTSTEPLIAPPFIWNKTLSNRMGIYGLQNFSVVCNYGDVSRAIKFAPYTDYLTNGTGSSVTLIQPVQGTDPVPAVNPGFIRQDGTIVPMELYRNGMGEIRRVFQTVLNAELQMKYITPHGTDVKPLRNVLPILEFPRFISSNGFTSSNGSSASVVARAVQSDSPLGPDAFTLTPGVATLPSQTYTFNQIPDKLIIFVRQRNQAGLNEGVTPNTLDCSWNDLALAITNINIQFNNRSGILANATQEQLFHMSQEAGSNQDWLSFSGVANSMLGRDVNSLVAYFQALKKVSGTPPNILFTNRTGSFITKGDGVQVATIGSYLMLDMGRHLEITEPFYAPGSLGSFQLQFNVQVENYNEVDVTPEIVVIPVNSGIMVTEKGQTSCYTGILTKADVLDAALQEPYGHMDIKRIVGHGHGDSAKGLPKKVMPMSKSTVERMVGSGKPANLPKEPKKEISNAERMASRLLPDVEITEEQLLE